MAKTRDEITEDILRGTRLNMLADCDVRGETDAIALGMGTLLAECDLEELPEGEADAYTEELVRAYIGFVSACEAEVGGSAADYCAENAASATAAMAVMPKPTVVGWKNASPICRSR